MLIKFDGLFDTHFILAAKFGKLGTNKLKHKSSRSLISIRRNSSLWKRHLFSLCFYLVVPSLRKDCGCSPPTFDMMLWISPLPGWPEGNLKGIDVFQLCPLSTNLPSCDTWFEKKSVLISLVHFYLIYFKIICSLPKSKASKCIVRTEDNIGMRLTWSLLFIPLTIPCYVFIFSR